MKTHFLNMLDLMEPMAQNDFFKSSHLEDIFRTKIAKSQATGKDGVRIDRFSTNLASEVELIERKIRNDIYSFTGFKERLILRGFDRTPRQISIPTVRDRLTLRALCQILHTFEPKSIGAPPHLLVSEVVKFICASDQTENSFVRIDVKDFFPSLSHLILKRELRYCKFTPLVIDLLTKAVSTPTGDSTVLPIKGVPQGLSISGALSSLYMLRFDKRRLDEGHIYFRYVDDILLICKTSEANELLKSIGRALRNRGLIIHSKGVAGKTEISPVGDGIDFLGYKIDPQKVSIRASSFRRMYKNVLKVLTDFRYLPDVRRMIFRVNLKITGCIVDGKRRGWMMFFSHTEDINQLAQLDHFVSTQLRKAGVQDVNRQLVKRFVKSYHEIRFNLNETSYIPNFDNYSIDQKADVVSVMSGRDIAAVLAMDAELIELEFSRFVSREVNDLEKDVGNIS